MVKGLENKEVVSMGLLGYDETTSGVGKGKGGGVGV